MWGIEKGKGYGALNKLRGCGLWSIEKGRGYRVLKMVGVVDRFWILKSEMEVKSYNMEFKTFEKQIKNCLNFFLLFTELLSDKNFSDFIFLALS